MPNRADSSPCLLTGCHRWYRGPYVTSYFILFVSASATGSHAAEVTCPEFCSCAEQVARCEDRIAASCEVTAGGVGTDREDGATGKIRAVPRDLPHHDSLASLVIARTCIQHLDAPSFQNFPNLRQLDLNTNNIDAIEDGAFVHLHGLETLILRRNKLRLFTELTFSGLGNLKVLELSYNHLAEVGRHWFRPLVSMEYLDLARNNIEHVTPGAFTDLHSLRVLNLTRNKLFHLSGEFLSSLTSLEQLFADDNNISYINDNSFAEMRNLKLLSFTGNRNMDSLCISPEAFGTGAPRGSLPLEGLSLKGTSFQEVPTGLFKNLRQLKSLDLSQTAIRVLDSQSFKWLANLVNLTLDSLDYLTVVESGAFEGLKKLKKLKLTNNKVLSNISRGALRTLPALDYLDLRNNRLTTLMADQAYWSSFGVLDLRGNPFICDCQALWMLALVSPPKATTESPLAFTTPAPPAAPSRLDTGFKQDVRDKSSQKPGGVGRQCSNSLSTGRSSSIGYAADPGVSTADFARQISCDSPSHLRLRCLASLPVKDFLCPGRQEVRGATDDAQVDWKVLAVVMVFLLVFFLTLTGLRMSNVTKLQKRQYRYKCQRNRHDSGRSLSTEMLELETAHAEESTSESDVVVNGKP